MNFLPLWPHSYRPAGSKMPFMWQAQSSSKPSANWTEQGIVETVTIYTPETPGSDKKIARKGILIRYKNAVATILVAHGFMCNKFDVGFVRNMFPYGKYNFLTFDFRAHGEDIDGQYCTLGAHEAYDVIAAAHYLRAHPELKQKPLFAYAFSMGAVATIEAQAKEPRLFDALILDCPFDSSENLIKNALEKIKFSFFGFEFTIPGRSILQKYAFHPYVQSLLKVLFKAVRIMDPRNIQTNVQPVFPAKSAANIQVPCFLIHCKNDEKIPVSSIKAIYESIQGPKMLWLTNGRNHYDSYFYNPEQYIANVRKFFDFVMQSKNQLHTLQKIIEDPADLNFNAKQTAKFKFSGLPIKLDTN